MSSRSPIQPLTDRVPIVNEDGTPTPYFIRYLQERGIDISGGVPQSRRINTALPLIGGGDLSSDLTLDHGPSGVAAGVYGDATKVPQLNVDVDGHITGVVEVPIAGGGGSVTYWGWGFVGAASPLAVAGSTTATLGSGSINAAIQSANRANWYWFNTGQSLRSITFDLGAAYVISGVLGYQDIVSANGVWQVQYSDDNVTFFNIGGTITWGATTLNVWIFANSTPHRYWRIVQTSGTTSDAAWQQGFMFRWGPA